MVDIAEYRRAEQELKASESYFQTLLASLQEDILIIDGEFRIFDINREFLAEQGFATS
jgi:PAS domain-containing protein